MEPETINVRLFMEKVDKRGPLMPGMQTRGWAWKGGCTKEKRPVGISPYLVVSNVLPVWLGY